MSMMLSTAPSRYFPFLAYPESHFAQMLSISSTELFWTSLAFYEQDVELEFSAQCSKDRIESITYILLLITRIFDVRFQKTNLVIFITL